jgi:hypothetical protein
LALGLAPRFPALLLVSLTMGSVDDNREHPVAVQA